jgi:hypothetical protein
MGNITETIGFFRYNFFRMGQIGHCRSSDTVVKEGECIETHHFAEHNGSEALNQTRRQRRMPDFLPVGLQNLLRDYESEVCRTRKTVMDCRDSPLGQELPSANQTGGNFYIRETSA